MIGGLFLWEGNKKRQIRIAPLRPSTLASFQTWGGSIGAGRTDLPVQRYALLFFS
jgi:hypothetical protein